MPRPQAEQFRTQEGPTLSTDGIAEAGKPGVDTRPAGPVKSEEEDEDADPVGNGESEQ